VVDTAELARSLCALERFYMNNWSMKKRADAASIWKEPAEEIPGSCWV
jgi:hypothetical protein